MRNRNFLLSRGISTWSADLLGQFHCSERYSSMGISDESCFDEAS